MDRATVMIPPLTPLMLMVTCMLSVQIASVESATTTTPTTPTTTAIPFDQPCTPGGGECASNFVCDSTTYSTTFKCVCPSDQYYNNSTNSCSPKKNQGDICGTDPECINNLICVSNNCGCSQEFYYDTTSRLCQPKSATTAPTTPSPTVIPFDQPCTPGSGGCASNFVCDSTTQKCACPSGQYYNSSTNSCLPKKNQGDICGTDPECINNLTCVSNNCGCSQEFYYDTTSRFCQPKLDYGVECQSSVQCKVTHTVCIAYLPSSTTKCLCDSGFYWTDNGSCNSKNNLYITATVADRTTWTITFQWTDLSQRTDVRYNITWGVSNNMGANKTGVTVVGRDSATAYTFFVVTSLPADGNYPLIEVNRTQTSVWTRPEKPGAVTKVQRVDNSTYAVTFGQSSGGENLYTMNVSLAGNFIETQSSTSTVLYFTKLQPAKTYDYCLWSLNGVSDKSVPLTSHFNTDPEAPPVSVPPVSATPDEPSQVGSFVGGVLGGLALVAVICASIFLTIWIRSRTEKTEEIRNSPHTQVTSGNNQTPMETPTEHIPHPQMTDNSHVYDEIDYHNINDESVHPYRYPQPPDTVMTDGRSRGEFHNTRDSIEHFPYENEVSEDFPYENEVSVDFPYQNEVLVNNRQDCTGY